MALLAATIAAAVALVQLKGGDAELREGPTPAGAVVIMADLPDLAPGTVDGERLDWRLATGERKELKSYRLSGNGRFSAALRTGSAEYDGYDLMVEYVPDEPPERARSSEHGYWFQKLVEGYRGPVDHAPVVVWVGDLDKDGALDFVVDAYVETCKGFERRLFRSRPAQKRVELAARRGC